MHIFFKSYSGLVLKSVFFAILSNFIIYNVEVVLEYFWKRDFARFTQFDIARFVAYFLFSLFCYDTTKDTRTQYLVLGLPMFLIDATTLVFGHQLIPIRFPYATMYPLLAIACGIVLKSKKRQATLLLLSGSFLFVVLSELYIKPWLVLYKHNLSNVENLENTRLENFHIVTVSGKQISIADTLKLKPTIIEFYFVGCKPCDEKLDYLKTLYRSFPNDKVNIMLICSGDATTFRNFIQHAITENVNGFSYFYRTPNSPGKFSIQGFPTQLTVFNNIIYKKEVGFNKFIALDWLNREKKLIEELSKKNNKW